MLVKDIRELPKEFDFKSTLNNPFNFREALLRDDFVIVDRK